MRVLRGQLGMVTLLVSLAAGQSSTPDLVLLKDVVVTDINGRAKIELVLSAPVEPSTSIATQPDRLIIDLPNTIDASNLPKMQIRSGGVRTLEIVHQLDPERTKIVIEVDRALEYEVNTADNHISLNFSPAARSADGALVAAKRGVLTGIFHHDKDSQPALTEMAKTTPAAATGGSLAGRQISQPPTSGTVQKSPTMPSQSPVSEQGSVARAPSPASPVAPVADSQETAQQKPALPSAAPLQQSDSSTHAVTLAPQVAAVQPVPNVPSKPGREAGVG